MLNFEEFQDYTQRALADHLPGELEGATVRLNEVRKNNGLVLHGITVQPVGSAVAPNIYLESYFEDYKNGKGLDEVLDKIARCAADHIEPTDRMVTFAHDFIDFNNVRDKVIMVVCNTEQNRDLLATVPHTEKEDLSLIYKVAMGKDENGLATILINNDHMSTWGVTTEQLHELAMENTKELFPVTVQSMNDVMREMFGNDGMPDEIVEMMFQDMPPDEQMYVISNDSKINGAASMFYEEALAKLSEQIGSDLYILPSSVHEVIAVSTHMGDPETLSNMVQEINGSEVSAEERLSDHVYKFDAEKRSLTLADTSIEEIRSMVSEETPKYDATRNESEGARPRHHR